MKTIQKYLSELQNLIGLLPAVKINEAIEILHHARMNEKNVFIIGNGGSAATASHMVCDLVKNTKSINVPNFHCFDLASQPTLTAFANDNDYDNVFVDQLIGWIKEDDVLIAISTSGESRNIIRAVMHANQAKATTISLTGFSGGKLKRMTAINIHVPSGCIEQVEDAHHAIGHIFCKELREKLERKINPV